MPNTIIVADDDAKLVVVSVGVVGQVGKADSKAVGLGLPASPQPFPDPNISSSSSMLFNSASFNHLHIVQINLVDF